MLDQIPELGHDGSDKQDEIQRELKFALGLKCFNNSKWEDSITHLWRVAELSPDDSSVHLYLAFSLFRVGELRKSADHFDISISLEEKPQSIIDLKQQIFSEIHPNLPGFLQGAHAPERHVFMTTAIDLLNTQSATFNILEIGSYGGSSMLTWSDAAEKFLGGECQIVCIDPWGESGATLHNPIMNQNLKSKRAYDVFCHNATFCSENVEVSPIRGTSKDVLPTLDKDAFDLIYIDGSHYYADVLHDLAQCSKLLKPGGIICGDDLELQLSECDRAFVKNNKSVDFVKDPMTGTQFHPGVTLAVAEFFGKVSCFKGFWAMQQDSKGFKKVSFSDATGFLANHWPPDFHDHISNYFETSNELGEFL